MIRQALNSRASIRMQWKTGWVLILLITVLYGVRPSLGADEFTELRISAGAKIFRALLAADMDIARKTTSDGRLRLYLLYLDNQTNAEIVAQTFADHNSEVRIRQLPVKVEILSYSEFLAQQRGRPAGVFLTQVLGEQELAAIIEYTNRLNIVLFSPFIGDVERGVQSGLAVEARVRPYLNMGALRSADVRLKPFFLKVAKQHAE